MDTVDELKENHGIFKDSPGSKVTKLMPINEDEIVRKARNGDTDSFFILFDRYKGFVWNVAYRMTYDFDEAEDLSQEIFMLRGVRDKRRDGFDDGSRRNKRF